MRSRSFRNAYPLPAVPWQRPAPFLSGPARHVSSPPSSSSSVSCSSSESETGQRGDHPRRAVAPLGANRLLAALECFGHRRPLAEPAVALGVGRHGRDRPPLELRTTLGVEEISLGECENVAGEAVRRSDVFDGAAVEILFPEVTAPLRPELVRGFAPGLLPMLRSGAFSHHPGRDHRSGRPPHQLERRVLGVRPHRLEQLLLLPRSRGQSVRDEQDAGCAHEERRHRPRDEVLKVGLRGIALGQAHGNRSPVTLKIDETGVRECVERPDHARGAEVERGNRRERPVRLVERMGGPQCVLVERVLRFRDDRGDRFPRATIVPGSGGQRLVARRVEEVGQFELAFVESGANGGAHAVGDERASPAPSA